MKSIAVLSEDGAFALFFRPHSRGFDVQLKSPYHREFAIQAKKNANALGSARGGLGAAGIDWCIKVFFTIIIVPF